MKKNLFSLWVFLFAVFCVTNVNAQATIGNTNGKAKAAEAFSALEVVSNGKGGLRLPQLTTEQRNTLALANVTDPIKRPLANGLSIFNTTTNCVEYWSGNRWISLCEGTSQTTVGPAPCTTVAADGTGCDSTFSITDPDCPAGPFKIAIIAGNDFASLSNVDEADGTYKISFSVNESVASRSVLVRVTSTCTSQYKDFIYMQDGVTCTPMGPAPTVSPSEPSQTLCSGGAVYLSVPANTPNLDKLIWTRNGVEVARGTSFYVATLKGTYNVSLGAAGCNVSSTNVRVLTDSSSPAPAGVSTLIASNNGVVCGNTGTITLTLMGATGDVSWFKEGILQPSKTSSKITLTGTADAGNWFAAAGSGGCYSKPSNTVNVVVNSASSSVDLPESNLIINGKAISEIRSFCAGGSLTFSVKTPVDGVNYRWYNGETLITSPYIIPAQGNMILRVIATDNNGTKCAAEASTISLPVNVGGTPAMPTITGSNSVCDGSTPLTIVEVGTDTYTYQWYKNGILLPDTAQTINVNEPGAVFSATVTSSSGCVSPYASKTMSSEVSSMPLLSWVTGKDNGDNGITGTANFGDKTTYQVAVEHGPATYVWTVDGNATTTGSGMSSTVTFPATGTPGAVVTITVKATNGCGNSVDLVKKVTVNNACVAPTVTASGLALATTVSTGVNAQVNVAGANGTTYQWYKGTSPSIVTGAAVPGATSAAFLYVPTASEMGTMYLYCIIKNACQSTAEAIASPVFTVTVTQNPASLTIGSGTFAGKTCFDINKSNYSADCGTQDSRAGSATDFSIASQATQNYIFTASASGTKTNLRFIIVDPLGAIESTNAATAAITGAVNNNQNVTLTINYKKNLGDAGSIAYGKTNMNAVKVQIYAIYNNGSVDVSVPITVSIQDCACCGAFIAPGVWKTFMCHNLGANYSADPLVGSKEIIGEYYQYGVKEAGFSAPTGTNSVTSAYDRTKPYHAKYSWLGVTKTATDPCPAGYRVPTKEILQGILTNNTLTRTSNSGTYTNGLKIGDRLFLPFAGLYDGQIIQGREVLTPLAEYWSSTDTVILGSGNFGRGVVNVISSESSSYGLSVRCVEE